MVPMIRVIRVMRVIRLMQMTTTVVSVDAESPVSGGNGRDTLALVIEGSLPVGAGTILFDVGSPMHTGGAET